SPLAGDDQHMAQSPLLRTDEETEEKAVRLALDHAVQVDARFERQASTGDLALDRQFERMVTALLPTRRDGKRDGRFRPEGGLCGFFRLNRLFLFRRGKSRLEFGQRLEPARQGPRAAGDLAPEDTVDTGKRLVPGHGDIFPPPPWG